MGIQYKELGLVKSLVNKNVQGVYHLSFPSGGYIGSSIDLRKRINGHLGYLRRNNHPNSLLQEEYNNHGIPEIRILFKDNSVTENDIRVIEGNLAEELDITFNRHTDFCSVNRKSKYNKKYKPYTYDPNVWLQKKLER